MELQGLDIGISTAVHVEQEKRNDDRWNVLRKCEIIQTWALGWGLGSKEGECWEEEKRYTNQHES